VISDFAGATIVSSVRSGGEFVLPVDQRMDAGENLRRIVALEPDKEKLLALGDRVIPHFDFGIAEAEAS